MKNLLNKPSKYFYMWIFAVFLFGLPIMTSYVFVQQEGRTSINIPLLQQMQLVEADLRSGVSTSDILKGRQIDLSITQSPFVILYSLDKKVMGSSELLGGKSLTVPIGVLDNARARGEVRVTWQPTSELRFASVTDYMPTFGYITVAQSLRETEARATRGVWLALIAIFFGSLTSGIGILWFARWRT